MTLVGQDEDLGRISLRGNLLGFIAALPFALDVVEFTPSLKHSLFCLTSTLGGPDMFCRLQVEKSTLKSE